MVHTFIICLTFQTHYKDKYDSEVKGHYIGSYEDLYMLHCQKVEEMKSEVNGCRFEFQVADFPAYFISILHDMRHVLLNSLQLRILPHSNHIKQITKT